MSYLLYLGVSIIGALFINFLIYLSTLKYEENTQLILIIKLPIIAFLLRHIIYNEKTKLIKNLFDLDFGMNEIIVLIIYAIVLLYILIKAIDETDNFIDLMLNIIIFILSLIIFLPPTI